MKTFLIIATTFFFLDAFGQKPALKDRELLVQKEYNNEIYQASPLFDYASINVGRQTQKDFFKDSLSRIAAFTPDIEVMIKPIPYKTIAEETGHKGFAKIDKGTLNPLHAQASYMYTAKNYFNLFGSFDYDNRSEKRVENKVVKTLDTNLGFEYFLTKDLKTEIALQYERNIFGLYGATEFLNEEQQEIKNSGYHNIHAKLGIQSFMTSPGHWNFGLNSKLSQWTHMEFSGIERNIDLTGTLDFRISGDWGLSLNPRYKSSMSSTFGDNDATAGNFNLTLNTTGFYFLAGIQTDYFDGNIYLWPNVDVRWKVSPGTNIDIRSIAISNILGAEEITRINPYQYIAQLENSNKKVSYNRDLNLRVTSDINSNTNVEMIAGYRKAINDLNFKALQIDLRNFEFGEVDYERLRLSLQVFRSIWGNHLSTGMKITYDKYAQASEVLFHRPTLTFNPSIRSQLFKNKLTFNLTAIINNPQTLDAVPVLKTKSEWRKNLSLSCTLKLTDFLNLNFNADNILDDPYQVWSGYDNFGRNLSGGILIKL